MWICLTSIIAVQCGNVHEDKDEDGNGQGSGPVAPVAMLRTCKDLDPLTPTGVYTVQPDVTSAPIQVLCDMHSEGGGWTLIWHGGGGCEEQTQYPNVEHINGSLRCAYLRLDRVQTLANLSTRVLLRSNLNTTSASLFADEQTGWSHALSTNGGPVKSLLEGRSFHVNNCQWSGWDWGWGSRPGCDAGWYDGDAKVCMFSKRGYPNTDEVC